jgi:hypothetical protein
MLHVQANMVKRLFSMIVSVPRRPGLVCHPTTALYSAMSRVGYRYDVHWTELPDCAVFAAAVATASELIIFKRFGLEIDEGKVAHLMRTPTRDATSACQRGKWSAFEVGW